MSWSMRRYVLWTLRLGSKKCPMNTFGIDKQFIIIGPLYLRPYFVYLYTLIINWHSPMFILYLPSNTSLPQEVSKDIIGLFLYKNYRKSSFVHLGLTFSYHDSNMNHINSIFVYVQFMNKLDVLWDNKTDLRSHHQRYGRMVIIN